MAQTKLQRKNNLGPRIAKAYNYSRSSHNLLSNARKIKELQVITLLKFKSFYHSQLDIK